MRTRIEVVCAVLVALALTIMSWRLDSTRDALQAAERVRDSLHIENAAERARADGWAVRFAYEMEDPGGLLASRDTVARRLARSLADANVEIRSLLDVVVSLKDSLTSVATSVDTTEAGVVTYRGGIADGLLTGTWKFLAPELSLAYGVTVPLEIVTSQGGDGRWLVTARATDPRATVTVPGYWIEPIPPVKVQVCSVRQTITRLFVGTVIGYGLAR